MLKRSPRDVTVQIIGLAFLKLPDIDIDTSHGLRYFLYQSFDKGY